MCPPGSKKKQCNAASIELRGFGFDRLGRRRLFLFPRVQFRRRGIERPGVAGAQQRAVSGPRLRGRAAVELRAALGRLLRLHFRGLRREEALHALRQLEVEAFHLRDLLGHGRPDAPERSKMAEQRALALVADAGDLLQDRAEVALAAQLAVEGDGEPVRLVAQACEQVQLAGVLAQHHRVLLSREEDALRAPFHLALSESALLSRSPPPRLRGGGALLCLALRDLRDLRLRPRPLRPRFRDAETLARSEALLILQHPALRQPGERQVLTAQPRLLQCRPGDVELALSPVDHQEIGQVLLLDAALQSPRKYLERRGEIIARSLAPHLEEAVPALVRLAVGGQDLRADRELTLEGGDVEAFDPPGKARQAQPGLEARQRLELALLRPGLLLEALARILHRHLDQAHLLATLRHVDAHPLPFLLREPDLARPGVGEVDGQQQLLGDEGARLVILIEEDREQLLGGELLPAAPEAAPPGESPVAEEEQVDLERRPLAVEAEHVLVEQVPQHRTLLLQAAIDGVKLVAELRCPLVLQLLRCVVHAPFELRGQLVGLALQEEGDLVDRAPVPSCDTLYTQGAGQRLIWY